MISFKRKTQLSFLTLMVTILIFYSLKKHLSQRSGRQDHFGLIGNFSPKARGCIFQNFHHLLKAVEERYDCTRLARRTFELKVRNGSLVVPPSFEARIKDWLKNDDELYKEVLHSKVQWRI